MYRTLQKPEAAGKLALTERDVLWIRAVHRFRFMTTDQAQLLCGSTSRDKINKRLAQLWAHDFLTRPEVQLQAYSRNAKRHTVHSLGQRGADWLALNDGIKFPKGKGWNTANKLKSAERMAHQIGLVDAVLHFDSVIARAEGLRMTHQDELIASVDWPSGLRPYRLPTKIEQRGSLMDRATDPDYTLTISRLVADKEQHGLCFIEWDNSSEDFIKANRLASSIAQKHLCYADAFRRKLHTQLYGFNNFRVLWVVKGTEDRVRRMIDTRQRVLGDSSPANIFWYALHDDLEARGPLADIWLTGDGQRRSLV